jgi:hypothetical protein
VLFRRRGRPAIAAAAVCWIAGQANSLFDDEPIAPKTQVKQLAAHFGTSSTAAAQRRARIIVERDRFRAMVE